MKLLLRFSLLGILFTCPLTDALKEHFCSDFTLGECSNDNFLLDQIPNVSIKNFIIAYQPPAPAPQFKVGTAEQCQELCHLLSACQFFLFEKDLRTCSLYTYENDILQFDMYFILKW